MTTIERPGDGLLDNLPLLTQVADEDAPDDLPTLTEVVTDETTSHSTRLQETAVKSLVIPQAGEGANESLREFHVSEEEVQRLLRRLETHLENMFANKLSTNLEHLQRQAIDQAVSELKAELPELLRNALNAHPEL
ncbi:MAG: hypothetical protein Q7T29_17625 [Gallionella sp.]|nr:hypothetical protein [Gallionella sp.]